MPDLRSRVEKCSPPRLGGRAAPVHAKGKSVFSLRECAGNEPVPRRVSLTFKGHGRQEGRDASTPHHWVRWMISDTQTDMLLGEPKSAICVQRFDDSLNSAIHTTYRSWLRSSSMREPRDPPSKVVSLLFLLSTTAVVTFQTRHVC